MDTIAYSVRKVYRRISRVLEQRLLEYQLTHPQWHFLTEIANEEGLSQRELTERVGVTASTTVSALRVLERRNFIRRVQDPEDARSFRVYITAAGRNLRKSVRPVLREVDRVAIAGMSEVEVAQFYATLERMMANLSDDAATAKPDAPPLRASAG